MLGIFFSVTAVPSFVVSAGGERNEAIHGVLTEALGLVEAIKGKVKRQFLCEKEMDADS